VAKPDVIVSGSGGAISSPSQATDPNTAARPNTAQRYLIRFVEMTRIFAALRFSSVTDEER
jgi:hypothetical protein